jgi:hypothetical protein
MTITLETLYKLGEDNILDGGAQEQFAALYGANAADQLLKRTLFEHIARCTGAQHILHILLATMDGQGDDFTIWKLSYYLSGRFHAVHIRHTDIHDDHIGHEIPNLLESGLPITSFANDLYVTLWSNQHIEPHSEDLVVIGD